MNISYENNRWRRLALLAGIILLSSPVGAMAQYRCMLDDGSDGGATSSGPNGLACGANASANPPDPTSDTYGFATAIGTFSNADGDISTAVGANTKATNVGASAFGGSAEASGRLSTATGAYATASSIQSTATGYYAQATGAFSTATGEGSEARLQGTATGSGAKAIGYGATATGYASEASGRTGDGGATATGMTSKALGDYSTANGYSAASYGDYGTSIGANALSGGTGTNGFQNEGNTALGAGAQSGISADGQDHSTAVGAGAHANAANAVALGQGSEANFDNAVAIGQGVKAERENQVKIGQDTNTYTLSGVASEASRAAQQGTTRFVSSDGQGNLATSAYGPDDIAAQDARITSNTNLLGTHTTQIANLDGRVTTNTNDIAVLGGRVTANTNDIAGLDGRVGALESNFQDLGGQISNNRQEARGGVALALAAAGLRYDDRPEKLSVAGGIGHFKGLTGLSFGVGYATSDTFRMNASVSGVPQRGDVGFSAGISWTLN